MAGQMLAGCIARGLRKRMSAAAGPMASRCREYVDDAPGGVGDLLQRVEGTSDPDQISALGGGEGGIEVPRSARSGRFHDLQADPPVSQFQDRALGENKLIPSEQCADVSGKIVEELIQIAVVF